MGHDKVLCELPGGFVDETGVLHREAELAQLTGREEELLAGMSQAATATLVTRILCQSVRRIGTVSPVTEPVARRLLIADRQYLLLKLREATFGDRVEGTLVCPWPHCGARVDIDFSTSGIPVKTCAEPAAAYRLELSPEAALEDADGHVHRVITFRLPNGEDQEVLAPYLAENPAQTLALLLERCIVGTEAGWEGGPDLVERLSPRARMEIEQAMEDYAPALVLDMDVECQECHRAFTAPFDLQDFFFGELRTTRDLLYRQVHYLAYHYHWSEREILEMPRDKRLNYIEILAEEMEVLNNAF